LEVLLKMNRPDFSKLDTTLKGGSSKNAGFQPAKPRNFDGAHNRKVVDAWLAKMEDYLHAAKVGWHSAVELAQSYLKGYAATWWRIVKQEEGKNHGYTWEYFKERVKFEFVPRNSDYISRCKLRDLVNVTNDNLRQYVRVYSELMFEIRHMHELNRVCQFVMGLPTCAKCKIKENWPSSLFEAIMKVEGFSMWDGVKNSNSRRTTSSFTRSHTMRVNGTRDKEAQERKSLNNSKAQGSNPREIL